MTGREADHLAGAGSPGTLEARLRAAAESATWPPTPPLRAPVVARIATMPASADVAARQHARRQLVLRALVLALVAVAAAAGVATALGYRLPGLDVELVPSLPPAGVDLDLGSPVPLEAMRAGDPGHLMLPATLPAPATAWVVGAGDRRIVTVAWRAEPGQATLEDSDLSVLLMTVAGRADDALFTKALPPGARIEPLSVGGEPGWWISGAVHELLFMRPEGDAGTLQTRLVGDTLVFSRDGTLYRFESALGREATLEIASSLR